MPNMSRKFLLAGMLSSFFVGLTWSSTGAAQSFYGSGMLGANQACGYEVEIGEEATSIKDEIEEVKEHLKDLQDEAKDIKSKIRRLRTTQTRSQQRIEKNFLSSEYLSVITSYVNLGKAGKCNEYNTPTTIPAGGGSPTPVQGCPPSPVADGQPLTISPFTCTGWQTYVCKGPAKVDASFLCSDKVLATNVVTDSSSVRPDSGRRTGINTSDCVDRINEYVKSSTELNELTAKEEVLKSQIAALKDQITDKKKDFRDAYKDFQREQREEYLEGGCVDCYLMGGQMVQPKRASTGEVIGQVALGLGAMYFGNQAQNYTAKQNARLGYPTQSYPSVGYGFPFFMGALYGAIGGGVGSGGFGCSGGVGGSGFGNGPYGMMGPFGTGSMYGPQSGLFGYPQGYYGTPMGGGMYMPGVGPWGMSGPWGNNPYGMGMWPGGAAVSGGIGLFASGGGGYPMGSYMSGGFPMAGGGYPVGGYPMMGGAGMGLFASGGGGYPMMGGMGFAAGGGYPVGGYPMMGGGGLGFLVSGGGGYPMMGGMGLAVGGGYPVGGGFPITGGMGFAAGGGGFLGAFGGGYMPGFATGGYGGYPMSGGFPMMGGMGLAAGGLGLDSSQLAQQQMQMQMQMQQQQMQMQMQQYQQYIQLQQKAQENYMVRQRVVSGLQQELYSIMNRIQQAQAGVYSGGTLDYSFGTSYTSGTINGTGLPGSGTYNSISTPTQGTAVPGSVR